MPYSNIVFVKLFLSLFEEDDRFLYQLNESQQLLYVKLLYLAAATRNKIPKNYRFICNKINYHHEKECLQADIERIKAIFHRFREHKDCYSFDKFEELHNYILGKSKGNPKDSQRIAPEEEEEQEEEKNKKTSFDFESLWTTYPKRVGKKAALRYFCSSVHTNKDYIDIKAALKNYLESKRVYDGFVQNGSTWFNNWRDWIDFKEEVCMKCKGKGTYTSSTGYTIKCTCPAGNKA